MPCRAALLAALLLLPTAVSASESPQVTFLLLRLDRATITVQHVYRYSQPLRKHLAPDGFENWGEVFVKFVDHGDIDNTEEFRSRYTGQVVFFGEWEFQGEGQLFFPTAAQEIAPLTRGAAASDPVRVDVLPMWQVLKSGQREQIWAAVRDLDVVRELGSISPVMGVIFDFDLDGDSWGADPEIMLLLHARSVAPVDAALLAQAWPRTLVTFGVRTTPEVTLHNFSDEPIDVTVNLEARREGSVVYTSSRTVQAVPPDGAMNVPFDTLVPLRMDPLSFSATMTAPTGGAWIDAYPDNDTTSRDVSLTERPVFRSRPWTDIPLWGEMLDFDGDGDLDVAMQAPTRLYQRDERGRYVNISARVHPTLPRDLRQSFAGDFTGDGRQDLLLNGFSSSPSILAGDGTGSFEQVTFETGLSRLYDVLVHLFDLDLDGDLDILTHHQSNNRSAFFQDGPAHFVEDLARTELTSADLKGKPAFARIDSDERPDLLVARSDATDVFVSLGGGSFQRGARLPAAGRALPFDYDGDGLTDILIAATGNHLYRQSGAMTFEDVTAQVGDLGADRFLRSTQAADLNADGRPDLVLATSNGVKVKLTEGGFYTDATETLVERNTFDRDAVQLVDWDADGDIDIYSFWEAFENQGMPLARIDASLRVRAGSAAARLPATSKGWLTLTLMGTDALDVHAVDLTTLMLGPGTALPADARISYADADHDGHDDLLADIRSDAAGLEPGATQICLEGWTRDGLPFRGCAQVLPTGPSH